MGYGKGFIDEQNELDQISELAWLFYEIALENIKGEEENAGSQYFLLFHKCFLSYKTKNFVFEVIFNLVSCKYFKSGLDLVYFFSFGNV